MHETLYEACMKRWRMDLVEIFIGELTGGFFSGGVDGEI